MTRTSLHARLAALHLPPPPTPLGLPMLHVVFYYRRAEALYRLSQGESFAIAAASFGLTEFALAGLATRAISLHEAGANGYLACLPPTPPPPVRIERTRAPAARRRSAAGSRPLLHAALVARVRGRLQAGTSRSALEAQVLCELAGEVRAVINELTAADAPLRVRMRVPMEVRHD